MFKYLVPHIERSNISAMLGVATVGALLSGLYGVLHDQLTYSISQEFFTKLKFKQFQWADWGFSDHVLVVEIGFLATWWVGFFIAWFLARRLIPNQSRSAAYRQIAKGFAVVFSFGFLAGLIGFGYGLWRGPEADYMDWEFATQHLGLNDIWSFVRVAYIHNASYLGGLIGFSVALVVIHPGSRRSGFETGQ